MLRALTTIGAALAISASATAQDLTHAAPPQQAPVAITNATVHTVSGDTIERGYVTFENGVITGVGAGAPGSLSRGTRTLDATGLHVYPGLVAANTQIGLVEISAVRATLDYAETASLSPEVRAAVSVNPDSTVIPTARTNGILTFGVFPTGGTIPGRASILKADGWTTEDLAIDRDAGIIIN